MIIPTLNECYSLIKKYEMKENIIAHSEVVMKISLAIFDALTSKFGLNRDLLLAGAILHDITKTKSIVTGEPHSVTGGELLRGLGFSEVATIVEEHVVLNDFDPEGPLLDKEIVYYSDKRVRHSEIVTLDERIEDLLIRYGKTDEYKKKILSYKYVALGIEKKISDNMSVPIEQLLKTIS